MDGTNGGYKGFKSNYPIRIGIHDPMSVADLLGKGASVEAGYITTFLIKPSQIVTSPSAKDLPLDKRKCLFKHDNKKLELFEGYTQANCHFECQLKTAYATCECFPWDYPNLNASWKVCDWMGRKCFRAMIKKTNLNEQCDCPLDCATTRYDYSLHSTVIDAKKLCKNKVFKDLLASGITGYPPRFIRRYEQITRGKDINDYDACIERTKNMAIVNFEIVDHIITRIKKTKRMTTSDLLSNIGKVILLF